MRQSGDLLRIYAVHYRFVASVPTLSSDELRSFFARCFSAGGGIELRQCAVTDDGVRCAVEYNCVRWGIHDLPPQAGLGVYQRGSDGLLTAARVYDDVQPPSELSGRGRSRQ